MDETSTKLAKVDPQLADRDLDQMKARLWQIVGAIKLGNRLAESLSAQAIHALEQVRDEKLYLADNCSTFDEFLSKPDSPMSHDTFRRRVNQLKDEGDVKFDLFNSLNVSPGVRKLLAGNVRIDGHHIVINEESGDAVSSTRISLNDPEAIATAISELKKKADEQKRTIERGKKDNEKWKRKFDEARDQLAKGLSVSEDAAPHARALVSILGNYQILADECKALTNEEERKRFAPIVFQRLAEASKQVEVALGFEAPESGLDLSDDEIAAAAGD